MQLHFERWTVTTKPVIRAFCLAFSLMCARKGILIWRCTAVCFFLSVLFCLLSGFFFWRFVVFQESNVVTFHCVLQEQGALISLCSDACAILHSSSIFYLLARGACFAYWFHKYVGGPHFFFVSIFTDLERNVLFLYSYLRLSISGTNVPYRLVFRMLDAVN